MIKRIVYTDGACIRNPGPGGWGWYVPGENLRGSGGEADTTNNRMEIMAVIEALKSLEGELEIKSDSKYVVDCINQGWWKKWVKNGWKNSSKEPVKNQDLWEEILSLLSDREGSRWWLDTDIQFKVVQLEWVKGHAAEPGNEEADRLAVEAANRFN